MRASRRWSRKRRAGTSECEYVDSRTLDGYELVTPSLSEVKEIDRVVRAMRSSGADGIKSSVHVHVDGKSLIRGGDAKALINLINLHEAFEPLARRLFDPVRGAGIYHFDGRTGVEGAYLNRFNRPLYYDHPDLLRELAELPEGQRTPERIEALFAAKIMAAVQRALPADLAAVVDETRALRTRDVDDRLVQGDGLAALGPGSADGAIGGLR